VENGAITGTELVRYPSVFDDQGNLCSTFSKVRETVWTRQLLLAIGQAPDLWYIVAKRQVMVDNGIIFDDETLETGIPGVSVGCHMAKGLSSIIDTVAAGRRVGGPTDLYSEGAGDISWSKMGNNVSLEHGNAFQEYIEKGRRNLRISIESTCPPWHLMRNMSGFERLRLSFDDNWARPEAKRCFKCDLADTTGKFLSTLRLNWPSNRSLLFHFGNF
jgi:hypothetical protein